MSAESKLASTLYAGSCLIDSLSTPQTQLKSALIQRLQNCYERLGIPSTIDDSATLENVQLKTADEALVVVEKVQGLLNADTSTTGAPLLGTRDLGQLRTLLSITFRWGVDPLLAHITASWPSTSSSAIPSAKFIDLTSTPEDYHHLSNIVTRQLSLIFPRGIHGNMSRSLITEVIIQRHISAILKPAIALGWLPKSLAVDSMAPLDDVRPLIMRLMAVLSPVESIVALGSVMSSTNSVLHVRRTCGYLMSKQLLRPEGVKGLCAALFGDNQNVDDVQLEKLQHISRVLNSTPAGMKAEDYFSTIIPRIMDLFQENNFPAYRRAAAFSLSQMLATKEGIAAKIILSQLHDPFLSSSSETTDIRTTLTRLITLLTNSDPSPELISTVLSPIVPSLYSLLHHLDSVKTSDPELKETVHGLLMTWSRIAAASEAIDILWTILDDEVTHWHTDLEGNIRQMSSIEAAPSKFALFTPETLKNADEAGELDPGSNVLDLYPEPRHFATFLKSTNRDDILSRFFVKLLEGYRDSRNDDGNPLRTLLFLQLIMQLQTQISDSSKSAGLFSKPIQILTFIKQALETASPRSELVSPKKKATSPGKGELRLSDLRLNPDDEENHDSEGDSDDDLSDSEAFTANDEMKETSITLLLSVLEGNETLSARTEPILNEIFELLEPLATNGPSAVRAVSREARMVMTARLALGDEVLHNHAAASQEESPREIYQKALKLLQDPILPVRAHGLLLLRQLAAASSDSEKMDPALVPALLEIFVQSIQDDDSYIFLNAVQGLAALVDNYDRSILKRLVYDYTRNLDGLEAGNMTQQDVDTRIRLGEALSMVIQRCGDTLGAIGSVIIPPLLRVVRSRSAPTTLRTSSLSLLADCQNTYPLATLPYFVDLAGGMVDLLQVETASTTSTHDPNTKGQSLSMDDDPTSTNTKYPPLRRAALHFLTILFRGTTKEFYVSSDTPQLSPELINRMHITLGYISSTDDDLLVRVMAREASEDLAQLERAQFGL
ncbi:armadillo-type protein [Lentinula raphanica]|nr:armadillo-type protein [Lentinula raphanica]